MWTLTKNLCLQNVQAQVNLHSKKKILETLAECLGPNEDDAFINTLLQGLIRREKLDSTGIGKGIAIPHSRFDELTEPRLAVITTLEPIAFDSLDQQPVDLFLALAVPNGAEEHLSLLAEVTQLLRQAEFCESLRNSQTNDALYNALLMATVMHDNHG